MFYPLGIHAQSSTVRVGKFIRYNLIQSRQRTRAAKNYFGANHSQNVPSSLANQHSSTASPKLTCDHPSILSGREFVMNSRFLLAFFPSV
jgi:hypothetical protein